LFISNLDWEDELKKVSQMRVIKLPKILQALFYLLRLEREEICLPNSQNFDWKRARDLVCERLPKGMAEYKVLGEKNTPHKQYQRLNYIDKLVVGLDEDQIEAVNPTFGKLFKWLKLAIATRKSDIIYRKAHNKRSEETRQSCLE